VYDPVLRLAAEETAHLDRPFLRVAGIVGPTAQAVREAETARRLGYHLGLLSCGGLGDWSEEALLERTRAVAEVLPVFGFYLQPAVGGRDLPYSFWRRLADIEGVVAIKIAPFDRYRTLEVVRAVCASDRWAEVALYTGNDDHFVMDLMTPFHFFGRSKRVVGGLLGQWAVWTHSAVRWLQEVQRWWSDGQGTGALLRLAVETTDANAAIFDAAHAFAGTIPGIHEVLRRQGLLAGRWCLDPGEDLSPGQVEEIDRVLAAYPHLSDDDFVQAHRQEWLR